MGKAELDCGNGERDGVSRREPAGERWLSVLNSSEQFDIFYWFACWLYNLKPGYCCRLDP